MKKINVAFLSDIDLDDITKLSGTSYNLKRAFIKSGINVIQIDKLNQKKSIIRLLVKTLLRLKGKLFKKNYKEEWSVLVSREYAWRSLRKLRSKKIDIIFTWHTPILAFLKTDIPTILYTDATINQLVDFYPSYNNFSRSFLKQANRLTKKALSNASLACFSSDWASNSAINDYAIDEKKVRTITLGANIDTQYSIDEVEKIINQRDRSCIHLLFIGLDWYRKGGDKAIEVVKALNSKGIKAILSIVGTLPPIEYQNIENVKVHGFINKSMPAGQEKIKRIFSQTHFLILPTRADCTPMVFAELNSYGVPTITNDVGGISSIVFDEVNGKIFSVNEDVDTIADYITTAHQDEDHYKKLAKSSHAQYTTNLNWEVTSSRLVAEMKKLLAE